MKVVDEIQEQVVGQFQGEKIVGQTQEENQEDVGQI
jgi:hypothetical protein